VTSAVSAPLNLLTEHKLYKLDVWFTQQAVGGNLNTIYKGSGKGLFYVKHQALESSCNHGYRNPIETGDTSIFSDKYDLEHFYHAHSYITVKVSDFAKLQKLTYFYTYYAVGGITGSKSDLYNGGANVTTFQLAYSG